jgi:hypothetical protein
VRERISSAQTELGRASRTARRVGTGARLHQLCAHLLGDVVPAGERQPDCRKLVKLDPPMLARAARVREQPCDALSPIAAVESDLAGQSLDRVPPARFVADTRC